MHILKIHETLFFALIIILSCPFVCSSPPRQARQARFLVSIRSYKQQPVKIFVGRILDLAWLKFTVAALMFISNMVLTPQKLTVLIVLFWSSVTSIFVLKTDRKRMLLLNNRHTTISGHFFAICMFIFHKPEVQTVSLVYLTD